MLELSREIVQRIQDAQRVLLSPLQYETPEAWQQAACRHVQAVMGAEHAYAFMPAEDGLTLAGSALAPAFFEGFRQSFQGAQEGRFLFDDPMPLQMHLQRMEGGAGVYHELALADRTTIEQSPTHQTLFEPHGVAYTTGMTVPLAIGEAALCVGFDSPDAPGYARTAGRRLQLLLPAFEAGVEQVRRLVPVSSSFGSLIDTLSDAVVLINPDGTERHANRAFRALLAGEPDAEALREATRALAAASLRPTASLVAARREVNLTGGLYRLRVGRLPPQLLGQRGTLVVVERCSPYPRPSALQERFQLTPREAEVALLLAEGRSNDDLAERLYISPHTVRHHVEKVLRKLDCASRVGVAHTLLQSNS